MSKLYFITCLTFFFGISLSGIAQKIYWSDTSNGEINVADLAPTTISNTTTLINTSISSFSIDRGNGFIYYCNQEDIFRADLATGDNEIIVMDNGAMAGYDEISYSSAEDVIYAAGMGGMLGAFKVDIQNGSDAGLSLSGKGNDFMVGVAAYDGNEVIYFADATDHAIYGTGLDGSTVNEIIQTGPDDLQYLAIDEFAGVLYYSTTNVSDIHKLYSYNLNTAVLTQITSTTSAFSGRILSIFPYSQFGKVYYVKEGLGLYCKNVDGSGAETQIIANGSINEIAIFSDVTKFYSRQSGDWSDVNTWSHVSHGGPVATTVPNGTYDAFIGSGHTVTLTATTSTLALNSGLVIESGGTLDANSQILEIAGAFTVAGSMINPGEVHSYFCGAQINNLSGNILVFDRLVLNHGCGDLTLNTDLVVMNGVTTIQGNLNTNGFNICNASMAPPTSPVATSIKSNSVTLTWQAGAGDAFVIARAGSTNFEPAIGSNYPTASATFGSGSTVGTGNFLVYKSTGTSVNITGLAASTNYEFDLYSYNTTLGGCYSVTNYQFFEITTCPDIAAPANPVAASYCIGSATVPVRVDDPGTGKRIDWYSAATGAAVPTGTASGTNNELFTPTAAGTFFAELVDVGLGCTSATRTSVTLTQNPLPVANPYTPTLCESTLGSGIATNVNLTAHNGTITGGVANTSVTWFTNSSLSTGVANPNAASISDGTTLYAKVTNSATQCSSTSNVTFTIRALPVSTLSGMLTPCANARNVAYQATGTATTFTWTLPTGASFVSGQGTNSIVVNFGSEGGTISVTPSNGATCQGASDKKTITISPAPALFTVRGGGIYCAGGNGVAVSLSGSTTGVRYELYRGANMANSVTSTGGALTFPPLTQAGVYTVKAISPADCQTDMSGSATVTLGSAPGGAGNIAGSLKNCTGKQSTYTVSGITTAVDYQWTLPDGITKVSQVSNTITVMASGGSGGNISVVGSNECGKGGFASLDVEVSTPPEVTVNLPAASVIANESVEFGLTLSGNTGSPEWTFGDDGTGSGENPSHTYSTPGTYAVTVTIKDALGCENTNSKSLTVAAEPGLSDNSIKNAITANGDNKNEFLFIDRLDKFPDNEVILLDRWGVEVFKAKGYNNDWDLKVNGDFLPAGNYICIVKLNEGDKVYKRTVTVIRGK